VIRILHVEDIQEDYILVERQLKLHSKDLQIDWAESARTALGKLAKAGYDCVLCDYQMPGMDGLQLLYKLREQGDQIPFIFLTGQGSEEIAAEALRAGADDYYTKEVGFAHYDRLINSIGRVVDAKAQRDERRRADERIKHLNLVLRAIRNVNQLITRESDIDKILDGACESLVETRGYDCAWIALLDEAGSLIKTTGTGIGKDSTLLEKYLQAGKTASCVQQALRQPGVVARVKTDEACGKCPLFDLEAEKGSMAVRLEHADKVYGVLTVSIIPELIPDQEEQLLFSEVAGDITLALHRSEIEKKHTQAEEALRKSEEWFRDLTESTSDWIWEVDVDGVYTYAGPRAKDLLGYEPDEIVGKTPFDLMPPQEAERVASAFREIVESRKPIVRLENVNLHKDGHKVMLETSGVPVFDSDGKLSGYRGVYHDITERKRSERVRELIYRISEAANAARNLDELFSSIHGIIGELMPAENFYIALYDHSSDMLSFPYFADQFDETPAPRKLGKGLTEYVLRTGRSLLATPDVFERLVEQGEVESIGAPSIDWLGVPLKTPEKTIGVLVVQTYTEGVRYGEEEEKILEFVSAQAAMAIERKRAEEEIRKSEERYSKLFEHALDGIVLADAITGEIIDCNRAAANLVERPKADLIGQPQSILHPPDDITDGFSESFKKHLEDNEGKVLEARVITSAGKIKYVDIKANLLDLGDRKLLQGIFRDVTERKRSDEAIKEKATRLELIAQVGQSTTAILDLDELLHHAVKLIGETFDYVNVIIMLVDGNDLVLKATTLPSIQALEERLRLRIGSEGITGWVAGSGEPLLVPDVTQDARYYSAMDTIETKSELAVPIKLKGKAIGVLDTQSVELNAFSQADVFTLQTIANQLAVAIDNARLYEAARQEITERKRAEEALRASGEKYRRLFESNIAGVYSTSFEGNILECNEAFARMLGYDSPEEIVDVGAQELYFEDEDRERFVSQLEELREITNLEYRLKKKDGTEVWVLENSILLDDSAIQGILTDITERKLAEKALQESEEKFRELSDLLPQPIFEIDARGRYTFLNSIGYEMSGYTQEEIFKGLNPLRFFLPEDRPRLVKYFRKMLSGEEIPAGEFTILRKDGSTFPAIMHSTLIRREGKPAGIRGIIFDITRRKRAEQELKESHGQLEQRTVELEDVNTELEAFSYSVSHDLRAPLRHLSGFSQILLDGYADKLEEKGKEYLHKIIASCKQMSRLIDDLLRLSHLTRSELSIGPVDLSVLARMVASQLQVSEPERKVGFEIAEGLAAEADARLMQIVLENLLGNAWKFSVKRKKAKIEFGATEHEGKREFFVRDNGVGFDPAEADKLFVAFQRLHTGSEFKGTGIGLATVQRIVHRHGGRIRAEGEVGKGATFYFTLG